MNGKKTPARGHRYLPAAAAAILLVLLFFISPCSANRSAGGGELRVPLSNEPQTLDPAYATSIYTYNVATNIFDGLVEFDENLNILPAIARRWIISRDHRTYTFYLRKGVKFHNGREVTADDFIYSFTRILDPAVKSPVSSLFSYIKGADALVSGKRKTVEGLRATDAHTLVIELKDPFAPFISILATVNAKVIPKESVGPDFGRAPVGTGPFKVYRWIPGNAIILSANKAYYAGPPHLDFLRFAIYTNEQWEIIFEDFENGLLDQASIPRDRYDEIAAKPEYRKNKRFISTPGLNLVYVGFNQTIPPFDDPRVRRAVSHAVDTETVTREVTRRGCVPAKGILPQGIAGYNPQFKGYAYDVEKARELLTEAGYPGGRGIAPVELWTVSKSISVKKQIEAYGRYLGEVGIRLVPKVAGNWKEFLHVINNKRAPLYYAAWYADYPDPDNFLYVLCHSESSTNRMAFRSEKADRLLEAARHETDYLKRVKMYWEIERLVMDEAPLLSLHTNTHSNLVQTWVMDFKIGYLGPTYVRYRNVRLER